MKLGVYTIDGALFEGEVKKIIAKTATGEITVLDGHIPLISLLRGPAIALIDKNNKEVNIPVSSGFLEVKPLNETAILINEARKNSNE